ncbi:MAG: NADPH:quinone reductase, partial [Acidimicrobiaceae bacterium]|nr:NADPH:quinone reductase [Acidimicrobiaceae bacterium]
RHAPSLAHPSAAQLGHPRAAATSAPTDRKPSPRRGASQRNSSRKACPRSAPGSPRRRIGTRNSWFRGPVDRRVTIAVVASAYGGPEVLAVIDEELGAPGRGQVLVDVLAAAANPADYKMYSGAFGRDPSKLPIRLGFEAAGVVAAVGEDAEGPAGAVHPGDDVIAYRIQGGYASQVMVPASAVVPKPSTLSFEEASGLLLTGATAAHALIATAVAAGDTVVVHGASGGVGSMAVQLAVIAGARVIATAGESSHAYLRQLGAQPVSYGDGLRSASMPWTTTGSTQPSTRSAPTKRSTPRSHWSRTATVSPPSPPSSEDPSSGSESSAAGRAPTPEPRFATVHA